MSILSSVPKEIQTRIKHKKDYAENWENYNPALLDGEMIFVETVDGDIRTKVGNGSANYNDLPFIDERFPKVTSQDDGKFLVVQNGTWVSKEIPFSVVYTGEVTPANSLGNEGDLYLQVDSI